MSGSSKPAYQEYKGWATGKLNCQFDSKAKIQFESNTSSLLSQFEESKFFQELPTFLIECEKEYESKHQVKLLMTPIAPEFLKKSFESSVNKSYRSNVLENTNWPNEPRWKWTTTLNWFNKLNDLIRTSIVCKYLDGPAFLADKLKTLALKYDLWCKVTSQDRDSGYYAQHFYAKQKMFLVNEEWQRVESEVQFEIQITTQMQEVLRTLSHSFYQEQRISLEENDDWKWNHKSQRFRSSFMGHTLHLLEGVILELREERNKIIEVKEEK